MRKPTSLLVAFASLLFASPLLSCAAEVVDSRSAPVPSVAEVEGGSAADTTARESGAIGMGGKETGLAYLAGTSLRRVQDEEAATVDPFRFELVAPDGVDVPLPDFSALAKRGYHFGYSAGDYLRSPVYATTSRGDVFYFEGFTHGQGHSGYALAHAAPDKPAEVFEVKTGAYAFFPSAVLVRGPSDVFVGASTVKAGTFGDDFPGCPISILHGQNGVYLAHVDSTGLHEISFPGEGRLDTLSLATDGGLVVETGWPDETTNPYEANVRERWTLNASGTSAWTRTARNVTPPAAHD